jgi:hypothetical protein
MIDFLVSNFDIIGINFLLTSAIIWLSKSWISERLKNAIKNEYDVKLESHKAQLKAQSDVETERLRSQLNITATEHEVRFAGLHNKRADVIAEIYSLLVQAYHEAANFASIIELGGEPSKIEKFDTTMNSLNGFFRFFEKNKIYLPENLCSQIESFIGDIRKKTVGLGIYFKYDDITQTPQREFKKLDAWTQAYKHFEEEAPAARQALEKELRRILGD